MKYSQGFLNFLENPHEEVAYRVGANLRGFSIKVKPDSYLLIVRITRRLDGHKVAFIELPTLMECFAYFYGSMTTTNPPLKWHNDRFS